MARAVSRSAREGMRRVVIMGSSSVWGLQKGWLQLLSLGLLALGFKPDFLGLPSLGVGASDLDERPKATVIATFPTTWQPNQARSIFAGATDLTVGGEKGFLYHLWARSVCFPIGHVVPFCFLDSGRRLGPPSRELQAR